MTTNNERGTIIDAEVTEGRVVYVAEHPEKGRMKGVLSERALGEYTILTDEGMEQMAEQLIGTTVEFPDEIV